MCIYEARPLHFAAACLGKMHYLDSLGTLKTAALQVKQTRHLSEFIFIRTLARAFGDSVRTPACRGGQERATGNGTTTARGL